MEKKVRVVLTIILSIIELVCILLCVPLKNFNEFINNNSWLPEYLSLIAPSGLLYMLNYYMLSPAIYYLFRFIWHNTGHYNYYKKIYSELIAKAINWLISCNVHWGSVELANEIQNANTCEGLLALRTSGKYKEKSQIYETAFREVLANSSDIGLPSKSLQRPTIVCTSMLLDLVAQERDDSMGIITDFTKYDNMANGIWKVRSNMGWGVYIMNTKDKLCSLANTYWVLRALSKYDIGESETFCKYVKMIYEYSSEGKFGFHPGDNPKLITTSMYLQLYYNFSPTIRNYIGSAYDHKAAVEFIYRAFVLRNIQVESETLTGMKVNNVPGPVKAPWNHITVGYAVEALLLAYHNGDIGVLKTDMLFYRIRNIVKNNVTTIGNGRCYYIPVNMEHSNNGAFTFPTTYLVQGLSQIKNL